MSKKRRAKLSQFTNAMIIYEENLRNTQKATRTNR